MEHTLEDFFKVRSGKDLVTTTPEILLRVLSMEDDPHLLLSQVEITITFRDTIIDNCTVSNIHKNVRKFMEKWATKTKHMYLLVQDYSESLRLHYHGIIWLPDVEYLEPFRKALAKTFGRSEIKPIKYTESYHEYIFGIYLKEHNKYNSLVTWNDTRYMTNNYKLSRNIFLL